MCALYLPLLNAFDEQTRNCLLTGVEKISRIIVVGKALSELYFKHNASELRETLLVNFFSVKYVRFFVSTESEFPKIYRQLPRIAEDFGRLPKIAKGSQRLPKITKGEERLSTTSKQGRQQFPKDFQPISSIIKKF